MKSIKNNKFFLILLLFPFILSCDNELEYENDGTNSSTNATSKYFGHEYVDLGLSVNWATCNVGANNPSDFGDYFAWAETKTKSIFSLENYKYLTISSDGKYVTITKYKGNGTNGDGLDRLLGSDDVARVTWGGTWRMPSEDEANELIRNTKISKETINGNNVIRFTAKNGNSIVIPLAGFKTDDLVAQNQYFYVNLMTLAAKSINNCVLSYNPDGLVVQAFSRARGNSVRPVFYSSETNNNTGGGNNQGNNQGSSTEEELEFSYHDFTENATSITAKFYFNNRLKSAKIYYGTTSSCSSSKSASVAGVCASATISGLKKNTKYYFKCKATDNNGSTFTTDVFPCMTVSF